MKKFRTDVNRKLNTISFIKMAYILALYCFG